MTSVDDGGEGEGPGAAIGPPVAPVLPGPPFPPPPPAPVPPTRRVTATALVVAVMFVVIAVSVVAVARHHPARPSTDASPLTPPSARSAGDGLQVNDHWHAALGVNDCGSWIKNWVTPTGREGEPARAGTDVYAGLHSHGDGIIHMEPASSSETGKHATLGLYFHYAGWRLSSSSITFAGVDEKNGDQCQGKPGVLRWSVNGVERHGDPAAYVLQDRDAIELVFTSATAALPPKTAIPSYLRLLEMLGESP